MPKRSSKPKKPDSNQIAARIVEGLDPRADAEKPRKNPAAVALGRLGGLKGGRARADSLSPRKRSAIAKAAAAKRWGSPR